MKPRAICSGCRLAIAAGLVALAVSGCGEQPAPKPKLARTPPAAPAPAPAPETRAAPAPEKPVAADAQATRDKTLADSVKSALAAAPGLNAREKRALIAKSEGQRQEEINLADGEKQAAVLKSEGDKTAAINCAQGEAARIQLIAEATAGAISTVAQALNSPGGNQAANLEVAKLYVNAFAHLARTNNTLNVPANVADVATLVSSAMAVMDNVKKAAPGGAAGNVTAA